MTTDLQPAAIGVEFITAFGRGDMGTLAGLVADDIDFESPRVAIRGRSEYLAAVGGFAQAVTGVDIIASVGDAERCMVMYDMHTVPFGTLRAVDHLVFRDGRIAQHLLVFDTYEVRKAEEAGRG
jgi:hypothetical protein